MADYVAFGLDPETFWRSTPREIQAHFDGAARRVKSEQKRIAWAAYQTAALTRTKDFPRKFTDFFTDGRPRGDNMAALRSIADRLPKVH